MHDLAQRFLTATEREQVEAAVREVEQHTSAEVVPMIVSASSEYPRAHLAGAVCCGALAVAGVGWWVELGESWLFLAVFAAGLVAGHLLLAVAPALRRPFVTRAEMRLEVEEAARLAFFERGLYHTRERTGILLFVSVFERRMRVLADEGVAAKVPQDTWDELAAMVAQGVKQGRPAEGLCAAVRRCGELVNAHFPRRSDDRDELANLIIAKN